MPEMNLLPGFAGELPADIFRIRFDSDGLRVEVTEDGVVGVHFESVEGFRLLDEGDLPEFWVERSPPGWLLEVTNGGWLDLESARYSLIAWKYDDAKEFLVASRNDCLSVISFELPVGLP